MLFYTGFFFFSSPLKKNNNRAAAGDPQILPSSVVCGTELLGCLARRVSLLSETVISEYLAAYRVNSISHLVPKLCGMERYFLLFGCCKLHLEVMFL